MGRARDAEVGKDMLVNSLTPRGAVEMLGRRGGGRDRYGTLSGWKRDGDVSENRLTGGPSVGAGGGGGGGTGAAGAAVVRLDAPRICETVVGLVA